MGSWKSVSELEDGQSVEAATFNKPLSQLADRTTFLKNELDSLGRSGQLSSVRVQVELGDFDGTSVGDVVCIDPDTHKFVKALSSMSVFDVYTASYSTYAVGLLVFKGTDGKGVVVFSGMVDLSEFDTPSMLEEGEKPRSGPYYLSAKAPGKITANPGGPRIQIGVFTVNPQKSGRETWDFAIIDPQYGDLLSHRHRTYKMWAKPAGTPVYDKTETETSLGTTTILGYAPDGIIGGMSSGQDDQVVPYLRLSGEWPSRDEVTYTVWLSRGSGSSRESSPPPSTDFTDAWLFWESSDPEEGSGSERVEAFYKEVPIGTKGLFAELDAGFSLELASPYDVPSDDVQLRTWTLSMPMAAKGWSANLTKAESEFGEAVASVYGVQDGRADSVYLFAPRSVFTLPNSLPSDGDTLTVDSTDYVFIGPDTDVSELEEGIIPVPIQSTPYKTYRNIAHPCSDEFGFAIVADESSSTAFVGASSASYNGTPLDETVPGGGIISPSGGSLVVLVCDQDGTSMADGGYATLQKLWEAVGLNNGMKLFVRSSGEVLIQGESAVLDVYNGCHGAIFRYNIEMDEDFNSEYPPVPAKSGSLVWNGVELESDEFFGEAAVYSIGPDSIYWYDNVMYRTPWPRDVLDVEAADLAEEQRLLFHYVSSFHSETGPVTSLRPAPGSPITVKRCGTLESASVGDLELDVDLVSNVFDASESGYKAVKASKHGKLLLGPVVEKLIAGPGIEFQQTVGQPSGQGTVTISATNASYAGEMDTIALENAKEEIVGMFPYVRLLGWDRGGNNIPTGFVAKFQVPTSIVDDVYRVKLYATVFGEESFSGEGNPMTAGVTMSYNILPDWVPISGRGVETASLNLKEDLIAPDNSISVDIPFGIKSGSTYSYKAFDPVLIHNDPSIADVEGKSYDVLGAPLPTEADCSSYLSTHTIGTSVFGVRPGYIVSVKFSRSAPSSGVQYTGRLGFINLRWSLVRAMDDEVADANTGAVDPKTVLAGLKETAARYNSGNVRSVDQIRDALVALLSKLR